VEATKQKEEKRGNLSPRNRKACHSVSTALRKSVAEIGTLMHRYDVNTKNPIYPLGKVCPKM
jgi:hypothetical protein